MSLHALLLSPAVLGRAGEASLNFVPFAFPHQGLGSLPPSLAAFCPWEPGTLVYVGFGMQKEALFYSLRKKQVLVPCQGGTGAPLPLRGCAHIKRGAVGGGGAALHIKPSLRLWGGLR